jgi:uncharacterized protein YjcR
MALNKKQRIALELLTSGEGMSYKEIVEAAGVSPKTLCNWRCGNDFAEFQEELKRLNDQRCLARVDAARASAHKLVKEGNQKMVEFVLKNEGYNPTQKVEADINSTINITIEE